jgi:hypothetical protein
VKTPRTPAEWQLVVDLAEACLLIDSARQYGLITGGPIVDVDRCVALLDRGRARGIVPVKAGVDQAIAAFVESSTGNSPPPFPVGGDA